MFTCTHLNKRVKAGISASVASSQWQSGKDHDRLHWHPEYPVSTNSDSESPLTGDTATCVQLPLFAHTLHRVYFHRYFHSHYRGRRKCMI